MSAYAVSTRGLAAHKLPQGTLATIMEMLFSSGELGIAKLDFSDFTGMYQDRARTIPYTAVEQPLGSFTGLNGVTATAPADVNRGVVSARVNTFLESEFHNGLSGAPIRNGLLTASALPGYAGAITFGYDGTTSSYAYKSGMSLVGVSSVLSVIIEMTDGTAPIATGQHTGSDFVLVINGGQAATASIVSLGGGYYRVSSNPTVITANNTGVVKYSNNSPRTFKVTAYDLRPTSQANLPYQRVNTATDYDTAGFSHYLVFNGTNTAYVTPSIDFTGTDKMTVWAGVTKLSDAADGSIYMFGDPSNLQNGSFRADAPGSGAATKYQVAVRGTAASIPFTTSSTYNAPNTTVFTQVSDIGADIAQLRLGGVLVDSRTTDQGTGNYDNYPLYIGSRAGINSFFNGRLYSLIARGAQSSLSQIEAVENLIRKTMRLP